MIEFNILKIVNNLIPTLFPSIIIGRLFKCELGFLLEKSEKELLCFVLYIGKAAPDLQAFHNDVNKLLSDIDKPINDDDLSDVDEEDLLVRRIIVFY